MINTKKVYAVILALIIALSMCVPAFAVESLYKCRECGAMFDNSEDYDKHIETHNTTFTTASSSSDDPGGYVGDKYYECPGCGRRYTNLEDYNACVNSHNYGVDMHWDDYMGQTLPEIFQVLMGYVQYFYESFYNLGFDQIAYGNMEKFFGALTNTIMRLMGLVAEADTPQADVAGAVDDLESTVNSVDLSNTPLAGFIETVKNIINTIRQKIKDFYAGDKETTIEQTVAEAPAETGSADIGIAALAAISVAAAAAFVCTKKKA